jgi:hypothetical protein
MALVGTRRRRGTEAIGGGLWAQQRVRRQERWRSGRFARVDRYRYQRTGRRWNVRGTRDALGRRGFDIAEADRRTEAGKFSKTIGVSDNRAELGSCGSSKIGEEIAEDNRNRTRAKWVDNWSSF